MTRSMLRAIAVALIALGAPAAAQPADPGPFFAFIDINGDGAVSRDEANSARTRVFDRIDLDGDGRVSSGELDAARTTVRQIAQLLDATIALRARRLDRDGDGAVSAAEFAAGGRIFDLVDRNRDGTVSATEIAEARRLLGRGQR
ncbi:MAG: EF-hand domain-containing protein [Paracoccaceae bacterium]